MPSRNLCVMLAAGILASIEAPRTWGDGTSTQATQSTVQIVASTFDIKGGKTDVLPDLTSLTGVMSDPNRASPAAQKLIDVLNDGGDLDGLRASFLKQAVIGPANRLPIFITPEKRALATNFLWKRGLALVDSTTAGEASLAFRAALLLAASDELGPGPALGSRYLKNDKAIAAMKLTPTMIQQISAAFAVGQQWRDDKVWLKAEQAIDSLPRANADQPLPAEQLKSTMAAMESWRSSGLDDNQEKYEFAVASWALLNHARPSDIDMKTLIPLIKKWISQSASPELQRWLDEAIDNPAGPWKLVGVYKEVDGRPVPLDK